VTLRPFTPHDAPLLTRWDGDPEVRKWMGKGLRECPPPRRDPVHNSRTRRVLAIDCDETTVGYVVLDHINWTTRSVEIRICIGEASYRNRGIGQETIAELLCLLRRLRLHEVYLRVDPDNVRAVRCYEKCGFRKEGILRKSRAMASDLLLMSLRFP
jgi:RimJ/RimL family protein N-acetyltransferase